MLKSKEFVFIINGLSNLDGRGIERTEPTTLIYQKLNAWPDPIRMGLCQSEGREVRPILISLSEPSQEVPRDQEIAYFRIDAGVTISLMTLVLRKIL